MATPLLSQSFTALPANVPSLALLQRPDVMQAEHALMAANADIGAARAAFFPSITLTGSTGYSSNDFEFLFAGVNSLWSFMPKITLPIFEGGRNVRNLELAEIRKESSVVEYEKAIQTAFKEVADALASRPAFARQMEAQARYLRSQRLVLELAESRYASSSGRRRTRAAARRRPMISALIRVCISNRFIVLLGVAFLTALGAWAVYHTPVDALPDLSDVQVIIRTSYPGQAPQIVENQITYPLTTTMLSVPGAKTVRGFSSFGESFV